MKTLRVGAPSVTGCQAPIPAMKTRSLPLWARCFAMSVVEARVVHGQPLLGAMTAVRSTGKPKVSWSLKASSPETSARPAAFMTSRISA